MNDKICINYNSFMFIMVLIIAVFYLFNINNKNQYYDLNRELNNIKYQYQQNLNKQSQTNQISKSNNESNKEEEEEVEEVLVSSRYFNPKSYKPLVDKLIDERDKNAYEDPLTAPTRRLPRHIYPTEKKDYIFEVPTRGYPDSYHNFGLLKRENDGKVVQLFGRQTYPGSNQYEYYIVSVESDLQIKHELEINNGREIYDGDEVSIPLLDTPENNGKFKLYMNKLDRPRYNPFVIN